MIRAAALALALLAAACGTFERGERELYRGPSMTVTVVHYRDNYLFGGTNVYPVQCASAATRQSDRRILQKRGTVIVGYANGISEQAIAQLRTQMHVIDEHTIAFASDFVSVAWDDCASTTSWQLREVPAQYVEAPAPNAPKCLWPAEVCQSSILMSPECDDLRVEPGSGTVAFRFRSPGLATPSHALRVVTHDRGRTWIYAPE